MNIHFFEEYPTEENLEKARSLNYPATIYLAAHSIDEFLSIRSRLQKINPDLEAAYWPVLGKSYWISPFAYTEDLENLHSQLSEFPRYGIKKVLFDLELPFLNPLLFAKNLPHFLKNKEKIEKLFQHSKENQLELLTAEYPISNLFLQKSLEKIGISYSQQTYPHKKIVMYYSSIIKNQWILQKIQKYIAENSQKQGSDLQVAIGTIATGVFENEPILSHQDFERDLYFLSNQGIQDVVVFRLGGLDQDYLSILQKFIA